MYKLSFDGFSFETILLVNYEIIRTHVCAKVLSAFVSRLKYVSVMCHSV